MRQFSNRKKQQLHNYLSTINCLEKERNAVNCNCYRFRARVDRIGNTSAGRANNNKTFNISVAHHNDHISKLSFAYVTYRKTVEQNKNLAPHNSLGSPNETMLQFVNCVLISLIWIISKLNLFNYLISAVVLLRVPRRSIGTSCNPSATQRHSDRVDIHGRSTVLCFLHFWFLVWISNNTFLWKSSSGNFFFQKSVAFIRSSTSSFCFEYPPPSSQIRCRWNRFINVF